MPHTSDDETQPIDNVQFRALIDGANDGLFLIHPETGAIDAANQTVCDWLGYDKAEVLEMTIFDCQTTFDEPAGWQQFVEDVRDQNGVRLENEITTRDGSTLAVEGSISVVSTDGTEYVVAIPRKSSTSEE